MKMARVGMRQGPFEHAMDNQVGITAYGRREMSVLIERQGKMPQGFDRVARLLERTQH